MRRFWIVFRALLTMMVRDRETLVANVILPIGLLLLLGSIFNSTGSEGAINAAEWLLAGILVQNIMTAGFSGDMSWLTSTRDRGILMRVRATPLPTWTLIASYLLVRLLLVLAQSAIITAIAIVALDVEIAWANVAPALAIVLFGSVVFLVLGQAIAAVAPNAQAANAIANIVFFPLLFLSKLVISALPPTLEQISRWNPAYMLVDLLRPALIPIPAMQSTWINLVGLLCYGVIGLWLAARFFRWEPKRS
jgi:ABC-2 type transport system permease protein